MAMRSFAVFAGSEGWETISNGPAESCITGVMSFTGSKASL
jgi:hypothetical protein